jgi:hypothetical protein
MNNVTAYGSNSMEGGGYIIFCHILLLVHHPIIQPIDDENASKNYRKLLGAARGWGPLNSPCMLPTARTLYQTTC